MPAVFNSGGSGRKFSPKIEFTHSSTLVAVPTKKTIDILGVKSGKEPEILKALDF